MNRKIATNYAILIIFTLLLVQFAQATYDVGDPSHSIDLTYGPDSGIRGWINLSFDAHNSSALFVDTNGESITLLDLFLKNPLLDYQCDTLDCKEQFNPTNAEKEKSFILVNGESTVVGVNFNLDITDIESVSFDVISNAQESCTNQINIDFFDDGIIDRGNNKSSTQNTCTTLKTNGCYNSTKTMIEFKVKESNNKHCQRINFSASPGFDIGAEIIRNGDQRDISMALFDLQGNPLTGAQCVLPSGEGELSCEIDLFLALPFLVCEGDPEEADMLEDCRVA